MRSQWLLSLPILLATAFDQPACPHSPVCPPPPPPLPETIYAELGLCTHEKTHLSGTIFDAEGTPVPRATVRFWGEEWDSLCRYPPLRRGWDAQADSAGRYELEVPWCEGMLEIHDPRWDHFPRRAWIWIAPQAGSVPLDYRFHRFRVRAHVVGPDGFPARKGTVFYYEYRGGGMCGVGIPSAEISEGGFEIFLQDPKRLRFSTQVELATGSASAWPDIWVGSDTTITIRIQGQPIDGVVRGYLGAPLKGATVQIRGIDAAATAVADSAGRFRLYVPPGKYRWSVRPTGNGVGTWDDTTSVFLQGPATRHLDLDYVELVGQVRLASTSQPLDSIRVQAYEDMGRGASTTLTNDDGRYRLLVRKGALLSVSARDTRLEKIDPRDRPREPWKQLERRYSRAEPVTLTGVPALADSTLDLVMRPFPSDSED